MEQSFRLQPPNKEKLGLVASDLKTITFDGELFRVFSRLYDGELASWAYFDAGTDGRFNGHNPTPPPDSFGTLYAAESIEGALSESIFRRGKSGAKKTVSECELTNKWLVKFFPRKSLKIADLTVEFTRNLLCIDKQIFTTSRYQVCHKYSHYLRDLGFDGIHYESRNSDHRCYALFEGATSEKDGEVLGSLRNVALDVCLTQSKVKNIPII